VVLSLGLQKGVYSQKFIVKDEINCGSFCDNCMKSHHRIEKQVQAARKVIIVESQFKSDVMNPFPNLANILQQMVVAYSDSLRA